jgi:subtilisin family serine protease
MKKTMKTMILLFPFFMISCEKSENLIDDDGPKIEIINGEIEEPLNLNSKKNTENSESEANTQVVPWCINRVGFSNYTGRNNIYVIDGGVDGTHEDLNINRTLSKSFVGDDPLIDETGHGTQIAGISAAKNNNFGTVGVASGASVVSVKIFGPNKGGVIPMMNGLNYIKKRAKSGDVVIISWTIGGNYTELNKLVTEIADKGVYLSIAAGNSSMESSLFSPQRVVHKNVYVVSAFSSGDIFWFKSNFGSSVNSSQPGVGIYTTNRGNSYITVSGTSYSAPHLAGNLLNGKGILNFGGYVTGDPDLTPDIIHIK